MRFKGRWIVIGLLLAGMGSITYLVFHTMGSNQEYYLSLSELASMQQAVDGKGIRLNAKVLPGSIHKASGRLDYHFIVTDGSNRTTVHYEGMVSDMFKDGIEVVVEGRYNAAKNHLEATRLMTKCPSKYGAEQKVKGK